MRTTLKTRVSAAVLSLSVAAVGLLMQLEGKSNTVYKDVAGIRTVCYGSTKIDLGKSVYTDAECYQKLRTELKPFEDAVRTSVKVPVTQDQFDAMVLFSYNVGVGAFSKSTLLRYVNSNQCLNAAKEFNRWVRVGKIVLPGLYNRRVLEQDLFLKGCT